MIINKICSLFSVDKKSRNTRKTGVPQYGSFDFPKDTITITHKSIKENPLNVYSAMAPYKGKLVPVSGTWRQSVNNSCYHCAWKMHLYANNDMDLHNILNAVGPYLDDNDISWKTAIDTNALLSLKGSKQEGKAFTIYPKSNREFEKIARDVDYIIKRNHLETKKSSIIGDNQLGKTGRIFYRYEFKTGNAKNVVLDFEKEKECQLYDVLYDYNRGPGKYLASDMTIEDDPWNNFDPAKSPRLFIDTIDGHKIEDIESCKKRGDEYILKKDTPYPIENLKYLNLGRQFTLDLEHPNVTKFFPLMKNNQYILIGRGEDCHLRVQDDDRIVSKHHAKIQKVANQFFVIDMSVNGTTVVKKNGY